MDCFVNVKIDNTACTFRNLFAMGAVLCFMLLTAAYLLEFGLSLAPCPLCLLQRYLLWGMFVIFLFGTLIETYRRGRRLSHYLLTAIVLILSVLGAALAARQVWLQHLPSDQVPPCTAGFSRLLEFYPVLEVLKMTLAASGECAKETFTLLGLSLASWSLMGFVALSFYAIFIFTQIKKGRI